MSRLIQITNGVLALPEYGDERFCEDFDEDCAGLDHATCYLGTGAVKIPRAEKPCPYLD
jgi:hypothetical protein